MLRTRSLRLSAHPRHVRPSVCGGIQLTDLGGPVFLFFINLKESL